MPPSKLLWIDLETTGLSPEAKVLEVGMVVTDWSMNLSVREAFLAVISPDYIPVWDVVAMEMAQKSGLMADIDTIGESIIRVDNRLQDFILRHFPDPKEMINVAGAGVHFDVPFIRRDFPWLGNRLHYALHDASGLRRWARLAGVEDGHTKDQVPHRALDDLFLAINDARLLLRRIT